MTAVLLPLLWLLLNKTNLGLVIRAGTSDNLMVQLLGINVRLLSSVVWAMAAKPPSDFSDTAAACDCDWDWDWDWDCVCDVDVAEPEPAVHRTRSVGRVA